MLRGRPREFDVDQALDRAMVTFWHYGYLVTSLDELTQAMQIIRPSLYAAFGDKEQLFLKTIDRYAEHFAARAVKALEAEPDAWRAVKALLNTVVD